MKKTYLQPEVIWEKMELETMIAASGDIEDGFNLEDAPTTDDIGGNLFRMDFDFFGDNIIFKL